MAWEFWEFWEFWDSWTPLRSGWRLFWAAHAARNSPFAIPHSPFRFEFPQNLKVAPAATAGRRAPRPRHAGKQRRFIEQNADLCHCTIGQFVV